MLGLMQDRPLLISSVLDHAARYHRASKIVSVNADGSRVRTSWPEVAQRAAQLAHALARRGVGAGERIATLAWNNRHHLELYYGVSGMGAVLHTVNPRLFPGQILFILRDAADTHLFVDPSILPLVESMTDELPPALKTVVVMGGPETVPAECTLRGRVELLDHETLIAGEPTHYAWPEMDERSASSLCHTSGTTGDPKGVLYSHRSTILHAWACIAPEVYGMRALDVVTPVVPMFHVNAWGIPYCAAMSGASLVLPGPKLDPASLYALFEEEGVTFSAGIPTIWTMLLHHLRAEPGRRFSKPPRLLVGGTAMPTAITAGLVKEYGVDVCHGWGMTEISPVGAVSAVTPAQADWDVDRLVAYKRKQGRPFFGIEHKIVDADGREIAEDGEAFGELLVRGPWCASGYFGRPGDPAFTGDGWFRTGDVATKDPLGTIEIVDRAKDVIKSGGEWISSIALENLIMAHPMVAEAAAVPVHDPKWDERPLLLVVPKPGTSPTQEDILGFYEGKVAKWWIPDAVRFVDELPKTATGKMWKAEIKRRMRESGA